MNHRERQRRQRFLRFYNGMFEAAKATRRRRLNWLDQTMNTHGVDIEYLLTRGWFCRNYNLQGYLYYVVVQLNMGHLVNVVAGDFKEHLDSLVEIATGSQPNWLQIQDAEKLIARLADMPTSQQRRRQRKRLQSLAQRLMLAGLDISYLMERSWFCRRRDLQDLLEHVVMNLGLGHMVNVVAGDFREDLYRIIQETGNIAPIVGEQFTEFYLNMYANGIDITNLCKQFSFVANPNLQYILINVGMHMELGHLVNVYSDDFEVHLTKLHTDYCTEHYPF